MINTFINEYNKLFAHHISKSMLMKGSQNSYSRYLPKAFKVQINRASIQSSSDKYIEEVKWGKGNNMAIAIGLNPSQSLPYNLDKTNELVTYAIYKSPNSYDGYYLMNLYSRLQTAGFLPGNIVDQAEVIKNAINIYTLCNNIINIDIILFFGSSFYVTNRTLKELNEIANASFKTIGNGTKLHHHPGRCVCHKSITINGRGNSIVLTNHYYK